MSKHASDDLDQMGYFLPEDSQHRLKKLCTHLNLLVQLAQPRTLDEEQDRDTELYAGDVAVCLELLAEQVELVLDALSWRGVSRPAAEGDEDAMPEDEEDAPDTADERFAFGITVAQIDAIDRLLQTMSAHGDVVSTGRTAELADGTLPQLGQAIFDAASALQDILDQVETQRLGQDAPGDRVGEERGAYAARPLPSAMEKPRSLVSLVPTRQRPHYVRHANWEALH